MSIKLQVNKDPTESTLQFIPASISNNGVIKIDEYFNKYTEEENGGKKCLNNSYSIFINTKSLPLTRTLFYSIFSFHKFIKRISSYR